MTNIKEFRIGNYIQDSEEGYCQITRIQEDEIQAGSLIIYSLGLKDDCWNIPLTEEWLHKFEFNEKYKSVHNHWNKKQFCLEQKSNVDDNNNFIPQEQIWYFDYAGWVVDIIYVHQLQNLYFAMTGEELTLTEEV